MTDQMQTFPVRRVVEHHAGLKTFVFDPVLAADPGQFLMLWLPGVDEKPFALSWRTDREMHVTVRAVGPVTRRLMEVRTGDWLGLRGPFGRGFTLAADLLLIGGGCGNAPIRFLAQRLREARMSFRWIAAVREAKDLLFTENLQETFPEIMLVSEDGSLGRKGMAMDLLRAEYDVAIPSALVGSGPEGLLLAIREFALTREPPVPIQLSFERYMKCGVGLCGQCCLDGSGDRVCVEGPVLNETQLAKVTEWGQPHRGPSGRRQRR